MESIPKMGTSRQRIFALFRASATVQIGHHNGAKEVRMRRFFATLFLWTIATPAVAEVIGNDSGGRIGNYIVRYKHLHNSGQQVVVNGRCLSACTLVLALPRSQVCATTQAVLGFHAAWQPDLNGRPAPSPIGTRALWDLYPPQVRAYLGKLTRTMRFVKATRFVRKCPPGALEAASQIRTPAGGQTQGGFARR